MRTHAQHPASSKETKSNNPFFQRKVNGQNHQSFFVQAKPKIGPANDHYEREADHVADAVVNGQKNVVQSKGISALQRKCTGCEEEAQAKFFDQGLSIQRQEEEEEAQPKLLNGADSIQRMEEEEAQPKRFNHTEIQKQGEEEEELIQPKGKSNQSTQAPSSFYTQLSQSSGSGNALDKNVQREMGAGIGADFSNVRVHTDSRAAEMSQSIQAKAFTLGNNIYFNKGQYNPSNTSGKRLLAHELTHTVQQGAVQRMVQRTEQESRCHRDQISAARMKAAVRTQVVYHHLTGVHPTLGERQKLNAMRTARRLIDRDLIWSQTRDIVYEMVGELNSDRKIVCGPERSECSVWDAYVVNNRAPIHLCDRFFDLDEEHQARTLIHEAAHAAGIGGPESEQYIPIWDCSTYAGDFHSADAWAHFIHCDAGRPADEPEVVIGE